MAPSSVSFRITRSTEDLAQTTHALSQRLVKLEQRLEGLELQLNLALERREDRDPQELSSLENVEQLLHDCRLLLGLEQDSPPEVEAADSPMPALETPAADHHEQADDHGDHAVLAA
ncbi:MAG: hypothetical protein AB1Z22_12520 [Synechococcaceae cyanobacterium]